MRPEYSPGSSAARSSASVGPAPTAVRKGNRRGGAQQGAAPQLLGGKADDAGVNREGGQSRREAEAVREEEVAAVDPQDAAEVAPSEHDLAEDRLRRRKERVEGFDRGASGVPTARGDELAETFEARRIVLLEEHVPPRAFEGEDVVGKAGEELLVGVDRGGEKSAHRVSCRPPPLGVQMGESDDVEDGAGHANGRF